MNKEDILSEEVKQQINQKAKKISTHVGLLEMKIKDAIDSTIEENEEPITISEVYASLLNVMKMFNKQDIMNLMK